MTLLTQLHSLLRWTLLLLLLFAIIKAISGWMKSASFSRSDARTGLLLTIFADLQLLMGLVLYLAGPMGYKNIQLFGMGEVMKNPVARFFAVEHITMMLIAIVLIHIGRARSKKALTDLAKHKAAFWFYLIALLLILAGIPWPFRHGFETFPWI